MLYAADFREKARNALNGKWGLAVGTGFVAGLLGAGVNVGSSSSYRLNDDNIHWNSDFYYSMLPFMIGILAFISLLAIIAFFLGGVIRLGYCRFNLNLINNTNPQFKDLFSRFDIFWKAFGLQLLVVIYTFLWSLLFIIPGIIAAISYAMAPYILEENPSMGINEAITRSKDMMYGNKWRFFCLSFSFIGWSILCVFTLGIGYLWLGPYMNAAFAAFYNDVSGKNKTEEELKI
jgi:uncharacterized membrane protein